MSEAIPSDGSQSREGHDSGDAAAVARRTSSDGTAVVIPSTPPGDGSPSRSDTAAAPDDRQAAEDRDAENRAAAEADSLSADQLRDQMLAARRAEKRAERELDRYRKADKARQDAEKSDLERAIERAEAAEAKARSLERAGQAREIATEYGIGDWIDELSGDADVRTMRAHAQRIRDRLTPPGPGMDGGVRSLGVPPQAARMDELIRRGAGSR